MNFDKTLLAVALAVFSSTGFAQATIDHNRALAGNVTPGDTPGYPVTLSQPGHYKLAANLYVPTGTTGILITARNVTLDLNGFTVFGPGTCTQNAQTRAVSCSEAKNTLVGGVVASADELGMTLRNGTVQGFGGHGIQGSGNDLIERVHVTHNSGIGLEGGGSSQARTRVVDVLADFNGSGGLSLGGVVTGSRAISNGGSGVTGTGTALVLDSVAQRNFTSGLQSVVAGRTVATGNHTNRTNVTSLGGNFDGTVY